MVSFYPVPAPCLFVFPVCFVFLRSFRPVPSPGACPAPLPSRMGSELNNANTKLNASNNHTGSNACSFVSPCGVLEFKADAFLNDNDYDIIMHFLVMANMEAIRIQGSVQIPVQKAPCTQATDLGFMNVARQLIKHVISNLKHTCYQYWRVAAWPRRQKHYHCQADNSQCLPLPHPT